MKFARLTEQSRIRLDVLMVGLCLHWELKKMFTTAVKADTI